MFLYVADLQIIMFSVSVIPYFVDYVVVSAFLKDRLLSCERPSFAL